MGFSIYDGEEGERRPKIGASSSTSGFILGDKASTQAEEYQEQQSNEGMEKNTPSVLLRGRGHLYRWDVQEG